MTNNFTAVVDTTIATTEPSDKQQMPLPETATISPKINPVGLCDNEGAMNTTETIVATRIINNGTELPASHGKPSEPIVVLDETEKDPHSPSQVSKKVKMVIHKWGPVEPINPERFFLKMLLSRGYATKMIPALTSKYRSLPSAKQIKDYDNELVHAIKNNDIKKVQALHKRGMSMSACNKFSESVVHMACRRASFEIADYVLNNGGDCNIVDDYGRTPLHDACWRMEPRFDVVTLLLDKNTELLRTLDVRGSTPLKYVREEHWIQWCAYIFHQKDKYWQPVGDPTENNRRLRSF